MSTVHSFALGNSMKPGVCFVLFFPLLFYGTLVGLCTHFTVLRYFLKGNWVKKNKNYLGEIESLKFYTSGQTVALFSFSSLPKYSVWIAGHGCLIRL